MNTQNMKFLAVVVCLAFYVGTTRGDMLEGAKVKAEEAKEAAAPSVKAAKDATTPTLNAAKDAAAPTFNAAKDSAASTAKSAMDAAAPMFDSSAPSPGPAAEKSESFAQWAYEKISGGLGLKAKDDKAKISESAKLQF